MSSSGSTSSAQAGTNTTGMPFVLPAGYNIETFVDKLPGARDIVKDGFGNYWVSQPSQGRVSQIDLQSGPTPLVSAIFRNLNGPHGLAIDPADNNTLYIAEQDKIISAILYSDAPIKEVAKLPGVGRHKTRSIEFGADGRLYVSIGSTCDVCVEPNKENATIISMNKDGTDRKIVATGLRNAVYMARRPGTSELWATDMGRDFLGNDLPPEEVNIIKEGHYGWPYCYGDQVRDTSFEPNKTFDCATAIVPQVTLQAHVAPLGLDFIGNDLFVAEHGSWNSTVPVGYKVQRIPLDAAGKPTGSAQDFLTGFIQGKQVLGRPAGLLADGTSLFVTDDKKGAVYRIFR